MQHKVVILGTGGTIAGMASEGASDLQYRAGMLGVDTLVAAVPALQGQPLESEQLAQLDSKDMTHAVWQQLGRRVHHHLVRPEVGGVVVTHGTDTMEETAWLLQRVLAPAKPVVITGAMRPASSRQADGPRNLADAVVLAQEPGAHGVLVVMGGVVHGAADVRKVHAHRIDAFSSGEVGPLGRLDDEGRFQRARAWPASDGLGIAVLDGDVGAWPTVEIVTSHAGASGALIEALARNGTRGLVIAATGNGSVHQAIELALERAAWADMAVMRATRCGDGAILEVEGASAAWPSAGALTPAKARVELMLRLLQASSA